MQVKSRNIWNKDFPVQYLNFQAQSLLVSKHISSKKQKLSHKRVSLHWWKEIVTYPWEPNQHLCLQYCRALSWLFLLGFPNSLCSLWCSFAELRAPRLHQAEVRLSLNHWGCWRATPALPVELGWAFSSASPGEKLIIHEEYGPARSTVCIPKSDANSPSFALPMVNLLCLELEQEGDGF